jgi:DNA invertase Pin-like site-specific DNA recombinase
MQPDIRPCLLIRVSTDEQETEQQEYEARAWIREHMHVELAEGDVFREEGVSGTYELQDRPGLLAAYQACIAGRYTHLVVRKIDRSGRNVAVMARIIRDLAQARVAFVAIMENVNSLDFDGPFKAHLFLSFAEQFSRNLGAEVHKGKEKRHRRGLPNGHLPYGVIAGPDGVPVADTRPITITDQHGHQQMTTRYAGLCLLFQLAAEGMNPSAIAREMNQRGYRTFSPQHGENEWARSPVRHLLDNRFYLGELPVGRYGTQRTWVAGAHAPLVDAAVFAEAQRQLAQHAHRPERASRQARQHVFGRGMLRCATCHARGRDIGFHCAKNQRGTIYYICGTRNRGQDCAERMVSEAVVERELLAWLGMPQVAEDELQEAAARYLATLPGGQPVDTSERQATLKARLGRLAELYELGEYDRATYLERRRKVQEELAALTQPATDATPFTAEELTRALAFVRDFPAMWAAADRAERARLVRVLVRTIWLQDRHIVDVEPTAAYQGYFALRHAMAEVG